MVAVQLQVRKVGAHHRAVLASVIDPELSGWNPPRTIRLLRCGSSPQELAHRRLRRDRFRDIDCWINFRRPHTNQAGTLRIQDTPSAG